MNAIVRRAEAGGTSYLLLALIASVISIFSFLYFFHNGQILLYGDAVAHINIARRVFDSRTPGWQQLGTVWLPLPHVLTIPFIVADRAWQSGWGGSVASMASFVLGVLGIARLFWSGALGGRMMMAGWAAALFYAANPNLIYLQSTAMTEPLSLALYVWALVFFGEFAMHNRSALASEAATAPSMRPLMEARASMNLNTVDPEPTPTIGSCTYFSASRATSSFSWS